MKKSTLFGIMMLLLANPALAQDATGGGGIGALGAAIAISVAALGGALGQAKIGAAAMDGIARNPQARKEMFVPMILGLVLIESLVIYALVVAMVKY